MKPITAIVVNAMSMFDIVIYLHSINKKPCDKEYTYTNKSYPECICRELIGYKITNNCKSHYKFAYIIAVLERLSICFLFIIYPLLSKGYAIGGEICNPLIKHGMQIVFVVGLWKQVYT